MIIFGTRTKTLENRGISDTFNCSHCGTANSVMAYVSFNYFHIFWIPFLPYSKKITTQCSHCKNVKYDKELSSDERTRIKSTIHDKIPLGYYAGLLLVGLIVCIAIASSAFRKS